MSITPISGSSYTTDLRTGRTSPAGNDYLANVLTPDDWKLLSAQAGKDLGPDENGHVGLVPIMAFAIATDRQNGAIPSGQNVTSQYLQGWVSSQQSAGFNESVEKAIAYTQQRDAAKREQNVSRLNGLDILA